MEGLHPPVKPSRDLAWPGRVLRAALALVDSINLAHEAEFESDELERNGWVRGMSEIREAMQDGLNKRRLNAWRKRAGIEPREFQYRIGLPITGEALAERQAAIPEIPASAPSETPDRGRAGASLHTLPRTRP